MNQSGIYAIRLVGTDQFYIGSTQHLRVRWQQHVGCLRRGVHDSPRLQHSWNKHGESAFAFEVLELCGRDALIAREQHFIDSLCPAFNSSPVVGPPMLGRRHTAEAKAKMVAAHKGHPRLSPEARAQLSVKLKGNKNALGCKRSHEYVDAMRRRQTGRTHVVSAEARAKMSASQIGNRKSAGRVVSAETRAKLSAALKGRRFSPETIARMSAGQRARNGKFAQSTIVTGSI